MLHPKEISIQDFNYKLPPEKIALHPLPERDASKLLIYKDGNISIDIYKNVVDYLPSKSLIVFNNTKVINARVQFTKPTGGVIEIFCLEPMDEYSIAMNKKNSVQWKCMIGGASKWKKVVLNKKLEIRNKEIEIQAKLIEKLSDAYIVEFNWEPDVYTFVEIIELIGSIPLPPYIKRDVELSDAERYQTIYAQNEGSVAAPTAGLHFTNAIFKKILEKEIKKDFITLHVGAGTFKPVKTNTMGLHEMHAEWIDVSCTTIENLIQSLNKIIAVGTTSLRTLESLYWLGIKAILNPTIEKLELNQWEVYEKVLSEKTISAKEALQALLKWCKDHQLNKIFTKTKIIIAPGYKFKIVNILITNFHQPQSTLLLLVAAAIGDDWKKIYNYALENDFRFLSYGDGNLIFIQ